MGFRTVWESGAGKRGTGLSRASGFPVSENPVLKNPIQAELAILIN